jgi:hypothetical protein
LYKYLIEWSNSRDFGYVTGERRGNFTGGAKLDELKDCDMNVDMKAEPSSPTATEINSWVAFLGVAALLVFVGLSTLVWSGRAVNRERSRIDDASIGQQEAIRQIERRHAHILLVERHYSIALWSSLVRAIEENPVPTPDRLTRYLSINVWSAIFTSAMIFVFAAGLFGEVDQKYSRVEST